MVSEKVQNLETLHTFTPTCNFTICIPIHDRNSSSSRKINVCMLNDRSLPCWDRCPSEFRLCGTNPLAHLDPKHYSLFIKLFIETELDSGSGKLEEKAYIS